MIQHVGILSVCAALGLGAVEHDKQIQLEMKDVRNFMFLIGLAGTQSAPAIGTETKVAPQIMEVRFVGFQALLPTMDDEIIFNWRPKGYAPVYHDFAHPLAEEMAPKSLNGFDGLVWGTSAENLAGHWVDSYRYPQVLLERDPTDGVKSFPRESTVRGRVATFGWDGDCNRAIEIRRTGDNTRSEVWVSINTAARVFLRSVDPKTGWERFGAIRGVEESTSSSTVDDYLIEQRFCRSDHYENVLWCIYQLNPDGRRGDLVRWIFAGKKSDSRDTLVLNIEVLAVRPSSRLLPVVPKDISAVHADVKGIRNVGVFEYSELGDWGEDRVEYHKQNEGAAQSSRLPTIATLVVVAVPILIWLRRKNRHFERGGFIQC